MAPGLLAFGDGLLGGLSTLADELGNWVTDSVTHGTLLWWVSISLIIFILLLGMRK